MKRHISPPPGGGHGFPIAGTSDTSSSLVGHNLLFAAEHSFFEYHTQHPILRQVKNAGHFRILPFSGKMRARKLPDSYRTASTWAGEYR
jgi:hypothetical protein